MNKPAFLLLSFLFVFVVTSVNVQAYVLYCHNPYFDTNISGYFVYNDFNTTISHDTSCATGECLLVENNGTANNFVLFQDFKNSWNWYNDLRQTDNITYTTEEINDLVELQNKIFIHTEPIVSLSYYFNETVLDPTFILYDSDNNETRYEFQLNTTTGVWHNDTFVVDVEDSYDYSSRAYIQFTFLDGNASSFIVDKFKIYTYDFLEVDQYWSSSETTVREEYCGENSATYGGDNDAFEIIDTNRAYLLAYGEDDIGNETIRCGAFKLGNVTIAGRVELGNATTIIGNTAYDYNTWINHRFVFQESHVNWLGGSLEWNNKILITGINLNQMRFTTMVYNQPVSAPAGNEIERLYFGQTGVVELSSINETGLIDQNNGTDLNQIVDVTLYNFTSDYYAGETFRTTVLDDRWGSSDIDLFWAEFYCYPQSICDPATNSQYIKTMDCTVTNQVDCEWWGCGDSGTCDYGLIGSYCQGENTVMTVNASGYQEPTYCTPPEYCYNVSDVLAECLTYEEYIDYNLTATTFSDQPVDWFSLRLANWFGVEDLQTARDMFALLVSILFGVVGCIVLAVYSDKIDMKSLLVVLVVVMYTTLLIFTVAGFLSAWITLAMFGILALLIFFMVKGG